MINLRKEEAEIFGGTGEGEGKSKVRIMLNPVEISTGYKITDEIKDHKGLAYLYYSTFSLRSKGQPITREYFKTNTKFEISVLSSDEHGFLIACASLWLAIYLGGFGTRARRGGGNIDILNTTGCDSLGFSFACNAENDNELIEFLKQNLDRIKEIIHKKDQTTSEYTNLSDGRIIVFKPLKDWKDALNLLGDSYKKYRDSIRNQVFKGGNFGMPVMHSKFTVRIVPYDDRKKRLSERWPSPLIFKVIRSSKNLCFPIIVRLSPGGIYYMGKETRIYEGWQLDDNHVEKLNIKQLDAFCESVNIPCENHIYLK